MISNPIQKARPVFRASLFFFLIFLFVGCGQSSSPVYRLEGKTMGTQYHIKMVVPAKTPPSQSELQYAVDEELRRINDVLSTYIATSELSRLNQSQSLDWQPVSENLYFMLELSKEINAQSMGAFDVTVGPLVNLWGFGPDKPLGNNPSDEAIANALTKIGSDKYSLDSTKRAIKKANALYIDLSAIAKGYGSDLIADLLRKKGIENFMVEIGGEIRVAGVNEHGEHWKIGVEKPSMLQSGAIQAIAITDVGLATSGDYRNYYEVDGKRFSHTINPSTGKPITHTLASVTVVAASCAQADALATALNVLGPVEGYALAEKLSLAAYFIIRDGEQFTIKYTPQFQPYLVDL